MAGTNITVDLDDQAVLDALGTLAARSDNLTPAYREISEVMAERTRTRVEQGGPGPDGTPWARLSAAYKKRKKKNKDKLLIYYGRLLGSIHPQPSADYAAWGTNVVYAAAQQFGADINIAARSQQAYFRQDGRTGLVGNKFVKKSKSNFAQYVTIGAYRVDIPARPFLGVSEADKVEILDILQAHLAGADGGT